MQDGDGGGDTEIVPSIFGKKYSCCPCCGQTKGATCNIGGRAPWVGHYEPCPEHQKATDT